MIQDARFTGVTGRPLRIAMIAACPFPYPRGTPVRILRMAEALERRGHEVHVVTYHLGRAMQDGRIHVHRIPDVPSYKRVAPGPSYQKLLLLDPLLFWKLGQVLRQQHFDVIHAHHYEGLLVARAHRRLRTPVIYDAHTLLSSELPFYGKNMGARVKRIIGRLFDRYLPGRASHVVAVTEKIRDRLVEMGSVKPDRITVVTNGVGLAQFDRAQPVPHDGVRTIVFTGNLASYQGIVPMLHAFRQVHAARSGVRLQIVTEDSFEPYEQLARSLGIRQDIELVNVPFEELPPYLVAADVAVNPRSDGDGIPQKLMNYMAAGRPIVSFRSSAAHLVHGETALLAPDHDMNAFAQAIVCVLDNPELARRIGAGARAHVERSFSWSRTAERTEGVYARVLQDQREVEELRTQRTPQSAPQPRLRTRNRLTTTSDRVAAEHAAM